MWEGFSLSSQPLIHNSLFRSENWTAKCYWGIFYVMTIAGKNHPDLKAKQTKTQNHHAAFSCTCEMQAGDVPGPPGVNFDFGSLRPLGWSLEGSAPTVWPGTPSTLRYVPIHSHTWSQGQHHRLSHHGFRLVATEVRLCVQEEWRRTWLFRFRRTSRCGVTASALRVNKRRLWITDASSMS